MKELERRTEAIRRVRQGESISSVCKALGRSRTWYYKWAAEFKEKGVAGLADRRGQHEPAHKTSPWLRKLIIETRDRLVREATTGASFVGIGAAEVVRQLEGFEVDLPSVRTVHRILVEAGRVPVMQQSKPVNYCPRPATNTINKVHQIDLWPRFLVGGERIYFYHLVDVACWYPVGMVCTNKRTDTVLAFLLAAWKEVGLPVIAQFDNEMSFTGGRWAHRLGRTVRLCLALGIQVWFIPTYTPERNGFVESFHSQCDQFFWSRHTFTDQASVQTKYPAFLRSFRQAHHLPAIEGQTPAQVRSQEKRQTSLRYIPANFSLAQPRQLPIVVGTIHCVRLADRCGNVRILNHHLTLGEEYAHHYVLAKIETGRQQMVLYHQADEAAQLQKFASFPFPLPESTIAYDPTFSYLLADD
ncbi:MAG: helix-turn-helix domain-containing protein [Reinekea sp.]|nr:helix-turn-helix domain-containing protein [Reinekea sp.]